MNDAAFLLGLRAGVGEEKALAADDGSLEDEQAAFFAGVDGVDLFVERLLIDAGAVDEHGNNVWVAEGFARILVGGGVVFVGDGGRRGGAVARPFLLGLF